MNPITELLSRLPSKRIADQICLDILAGRYEVSELMDCFFNEDWKINQNASWVVTKMADSHPERLHPYLEKMLQNLEKPQHDAVIRNTVRTWQFMEIPDSLIGPIYDKVFELFADPNQPIAIRVFSMTVCCNIAERFPELAAEIKPIILEYWDHTTAAWRSRGKKELKRLDGLL